MIHALAALQARQDLPLFLLPIFRHHDQDRFPDRFRSRIAVKALRPAVPTGDLPGEIIADNGIIRGVDDAGTLLARTAGSEAHCDQQAAGWSDGHAPSSKAGRWGVVQSETTCHVTIDVTNMKLADG